MCIRLDYYTKENTRSIFVSTYWSLLVVEGIFKELFVPFLLVGYIYNDIDAFFRWWSMDLHEQDSPIVPLLMKSYMDLDNTSVIPNMIEEASHFKHL